MTTDIDTTADKYLRDKYAIIGVGETTYTRGSGDDHPRPGHLGDQERDGRRGDSGIRESTG